MEGEIYPLFSKPVYAKVIDIDVDKIIPLVEDLPTSLPIFPFKKVLNDRLVLFFVLSSIIGRLYIFPSGLEHDVPIIEERTKNRTSLSFNTFLKGKIGSDVGKTGLIL